MTSYFEYNARKPELDVLEPDDTLEDTGIHVVHERMGTDTYKILIDEFNKWRNRNDCV